MFRMSSSENTCVPSDEELVECIRRGEAGAWENLHARYTIRLLSFLAARCPRGADFEELEQELWFRVLRALKDFKGTSFSGFVFEIARNLLIDDFRKRERKPEASFPDGLEPAEAFVPIEDERLELMRDCLKTLDGVFIETLIRIKLRGESPERIAAEEGVPRKTIDTRVHRGKQQLGECIRGKLS
jgi:RNA polymerase sigma-70 factor, ECF subfamily